MVNIELRGYASKGVSKTSKSGKQYCTFTVGVKQKEKAWGDKPEVVTWANFSVTDYNHPEAPPEKSFVTIKGFMKVRKYEIEGTQRQSLDVTAQELTVAEPFDNGTKAATAPTKDPWD